MQLSPPGMPVSERGINLDDDPDLDYISSCPTKVGPVSAGLTNMSEGDVLAVIAAEMLQARRVRGEVLPKELFSEPAWELLLELFIAATTQQRLTGRDIAIRSDTPVQVMSRWIRHLQNIDLLKGEEGGHLDDTLELSDRALAHMKRTLSLSRPYRGAPSQ